MRGTWARRAAAAVAAIGAAAALAVVGTSSATATEGYCGLSWGSLPKAAAPTETGALTGVRGGRHECWDRLVLDVRAPGADGFRVEYVDEVTEDGSGQVVPLRGGAKLQVVAIAPAYDSAGNPTYTPANRRELVDVTGWDTFRQVAWAGSFEGQTTIGLGVRARLPFRAFVLDGPGSGSRIVVDVAHRWS
ncbi:AMIN-like domain-containing (lipo)protein [Actinokineospora sp. NPDC004072]